MIVRVWTKYYYGEHGNFRYAPRGLREQHEDVVGIYRSYGSNPTI